MPRQSNVKIFSRPELRMPAMVCGISGWVDGGQSATGTIDYLEDKLQAEPLASIKIDRFHIFQVPGQVSLRPHVKMEDGLITEHEYPENRFTYRVNPGSSKDLILFDGTEPNLNWDEYAAAVLYVARQFDVSRIYLLGGVLDKTPHTKEPNVSCGCSSPELKEEMKKYGVQYSSYEGPGRFGTTLLYYCQQKDIEMVSFTTRVTYYPEFNIVISRNPKTIRTLVRRLNSLLELSLDISDLDSEVEEFEEQLNQMAANTPEFGTYLEELEKEYEELIYEEPLEFSAGEAIRIAEELLKRDAQG